ncbi:MAG: acyltransferase [Betaproteobacteria bacterium]|nr:acyltransferase [Betaproteobacteria bacterium]
MGWIGVDLFLVISGFVIGKTAIESFTRNPDGWRSLYIERRFRRIAPLHIATVFLYALLISPQILTLGGDSVFHLFSHVFFIHNLFPSTYGSINGVNWSVALEMQFYMLVALSTLVGSHKLAASDDGVGWYCHHLAVCHNSRLRSHGGPSAQPNSGSHYASGHHRSVRHGHLPCKTEYRWQVVIHAQAIFSMDSCSNHLADSLTGNLRSSLCVLVLSANDLVLADAGISCICCLARCFHHDPLFRRMAYQALSIPR